MLAGLDLKNYIGRTPIMSRRPNNPKKWLLTLFESIVESRECIGAVMQRWSSFFESTMMDDSF